MNKKSETSAENAPQRDLVLQIPLTKLRPFSLHVFKIYEGKKLDLLVQSVRGNGVIQPIIVRRIKDSDVFEIISGHNRVKAAELADLSQIPAVVTELSDDEAIVLSNVTNITQRAFKDWFPSEKSNSVYQFYAATKRQGKRTDLQSETIGGKRQKLENDSTRTKTACVYGESEYKIRLYLELYKLIDPFKVRLDNKIFNTTAAQNLAHISKKGQLLINSIVEEDINGGTYKITSFNSKELRDELENVVFNDLTEDEKETVVDALKHILMQKPIPPESDEQLISIKMARDEYNRLFSEKEKDEVVAEIIEAVDNYRNRDLYPRILRKNDTLQKP